MLAKPLRSVVLAESRLLAILGAIVSKAILDPPKQITCQLMPLNDHEYYVEEMNHPADPSPEYQLTKLGDEVKRLLF